MLEKEDYEGVYQVASFHPDYCFADSEVDDPANYTNRAPYPIFHLLREQSIESALAHFNNPENIPRANIQLARELGHTKMQSLLETAKKLNKD